MPDIKADSEEPKQLPVFQCNIDSRPSFNRTPIGWVCTEDLSYAPLTLEPIPFEAETEDLWKPCSANSCRLYLAQVNLNDYYNVEDIYEISWGLAAMRATAITIQYCISNVQIRCKYSYVLDINMWSQLMINMSLFKRLKSMNMS